MTTQGNSSDSKMAAKRPPFLIGDKITVKIDSLAFGGAGVSRSNGFVVFVSGAVPGDEIEVQITEVKKNFATAEIIQILCPGPTRISPPCPYAGKCGGCEWQQVNYLEQLKQKQKIVEDAVVKKLVNKCKLLNTIVPSPQEFRYRNRIQVKVSEGKLGFYEKRSHNIVDIEDCLLADLRLMRDFKKLRNMYPGKDLVEIELALTPSGQVTTGKKGEGHLFGAFAQVNSEQNSLLVAEVLTLAEKSQCKMLYDLYCGDGNFTFPLLNKFTGTKVIGVELSAALLERADKTRRELDHDRVQFVCSDVFSFLRKVRNMDNSLVILDPPRVGCDGEVMEILSTLKPMAIIYISCNPMTFVRDVNRLIGYEVESLTPFDMFPQTSHIELVSFLRRKD